MHGSPREAFGLPHREEVEVGWVEDSSGAQTPGQLLAALVGLDHGDVGDTHGLQGDHRERSDGARPDDHGGITGGDPGSGDAMEGDGQGLGQRGMTGREAFREAEHTGRRHQDVLGKGSVRPVGDVDRAVLALGGFALDTATAHPAPGGGTTHHLLADRPGVDTLAEGHDGPGPFVTGHRTRFEAPAISQLVDIRTADSAVVYGDQNLTRPRRRNGTALYGDDSRRLIDRRGHGVGAWRR